MNIRWIVWRGDGNATLAECQDRATDLGSYAHVQRVIEATFRGLSWQDSVGFWTDKRVQLQFLLAANSRPRFIDVLITAEEGFNVERHLGGRFRRLALE